MTAPLLAFTAVVAIFQIAALFNKQEAVLDLSNSKSLAGLYLRDKLDAQLSNISDREKGGRRTDLMLPKDSKVFIAGMTGPTNFWKRIYLYRLTYQLFPREVAVSLDQPAVQTQDGFHGRGDVSDEEIFANGFDLIVKITPQFSVHPRPGLPIRTVSNPDWFDSRTDFTIAFLLPLLTAISGMLLLRLLFAQTAAKMGVLEQMACAFGLGMMAVAALTLSMKLWGFHGYRVVYCAVTLGSVVELLRNQKSYWAAVAGWSSRVIRNPVTIVAVVIGVITFVLMFRLAGLAPMVEYDAQMSWGLKAKIMHLYAGRELIEWFSNPRLAHAHLDYPPLMSALHTATYDSLGHVDDFVSKFWPVWMLLFLIAALASLVNRARGWFQAPKLVLLGIMLIPATLQYALWEGATMPATFFTALGCMQCALATVKKEPARLCLGLTLLFGGAMTKFEGGVFLILAFASLLLLPAARTMLRMSIASWSAAFFCFAVVLPYVCLRARIPSLNFESNWAGNILLQPGATLANWPAIFLMMFSRLFASPELADWIDNDGHFQWCGHWGGISTVFDPQTMGLVWLCVAMTFVLWLAASERRAVILWISVMVIGTVAFYSVISAGFVNAHSAEHLVDHDQLTPRYYIPMLESTQRYFFPTLATWFFTILAVSFMSNPAVDDPRK